MKTFDKYSPDGNARRFRPLASLLMAVVTIAAMSCSGKFEVGHDVDSSLYILKSGKQEMTVSRDSGPYSLYVCKAGLNDDVFAVSLVTDPEDLVTYNARYMSAYRILPPNSYEFSERNVLVGKDDVKTAVRIEFRYDCVPSGISVLPVRLRCTSDASVLMKEEYSVVWLFVTKED